MKKLMSKLTLLSCLTSVSMGFALTTQECLINSVDPKIMDAAIALKGSPTDFLNQYVPNWQSMDKNALQDSVNSKIADQVTQLGGVGTIIDCYGYMLERVAAQPDLFRDLCVQYSESLGEEKISLPIQLYPEGRKFAGIGLEDLIAMWISLSKDNLLVMRQQLESKFANLQELVDWTRKWVVEMSSYFGDKKIQFLKDSLNRTDLSDNFKSLLQEKLTTQQTELAQIQDVNSIAINVPMLQGLMLLNVVKQVAKEHQTTTPQSSVPTTVVA